MSKGKIQQILPEKFELLKGVSIANTIHRNLF